MNTTTNTTEIIEYKTQGTCSKKITLTLSNNIIKKAVFQGGCPGNLRGIETLITGMQINEVILKLNGITCGDKPTSCPDQLAKCLIQYEAREKSLR